MQPSRDLDVQTFLDTQPFSAFQWRIFALCFLIVLLDGFDTAAIGYIAPSLIQEWGVTKPALAPVLSAALFGLAGGALSAGPLADRFGRKAVLNASVLVFAVACLASAFATDLQSLTVWRFVTGLGLGAAMPNAVTMMSEYCPSARRAMLTNAMFCGFPLGAAFGGFLAAWMIPHFGWRSVLVLGGVAPLVLLVLMLLLLPESIRYMVAKGQPTERIRAVLAGEQSVETLLARRQRMAATANGFGRPRVVVDDRLSDDDTVIEIKCADRLGLLYDADVRAAHAGLTAGGSAIEESRPHGVVRRTRGLAERWRGETTAPDLATIRAVWEEFDLPLYREPSDWVQTGDRG